jgi:hypothetical protein
MFCTPRLVFDGTEGVGSRFYVFRSMTCFRRYRRRRVPFSSFAPPYKFSAVTGVSVPFSCFALLESFSAVPRVSVPFSCLARPDSFSAVPRASDPVFMFCVSTHVFGSTEGVGSRFYVLRLRTRFRRCRGRRVPFSCFASPAIVFDSTEGDGSRFQVLRCQTPFRRFRGRRILFSCFTSPHSFSAIPRASGPVFMFCASGLVFSSTECVGSRFNVLRTRTRLRRFRGRQVPFSFFRPRSRFRRYRGCRVPFSCFASLHSFSAVPRASSPFFMICILVLVYGGTERDGSRFHVLRSRTHFRGFRGRRDPFSCFASPHSFSLVSRAWGPVFMFCVPGLVFGGSEGVGSRFHVLCPYTRFR